MAEHGMILKPEHVDYSDLKKFGTVTIRYSDTPKLCGLVVTVSGFEFENATSCRDTCTKAAAWARDVLAAAVAADTLAPGGMLIVVAN